LTPKELGHVVLVQQLLGVIERVGSRATAALVTAALTVVNIAIAMFNIFYM